MRDAWRESDYLDISLDAARAQWRRVLDRPDYVRGRRQEAFLPVETLLSQAASTVVTHSHFGGSTAHTAGTPVREIAALCKRPSSSILAKMANLDGSRANGARWDLRVGTRLRIDLSLMTAVYAVVMEAARQAGITRDVLPDFLGLEEGDTLVLLGQEELESSAVEDVMGREIDAWLKRLPELPERETEKLFVANARIGQHQFAKAVLHNCGGRCVFCGLSIPEGAASKMLIASHIKPWRSSSNRERLDHLNGVAACPSHDAAFDTGLMGIEADLSVVLSPRLRAHIAADAPARAVFGSPPLTPKISLPADSEFPAATYLNWHRTKIYQDLRVSESRG